MTSDMNPPAFPRNYTAGGHNGMELRDYFAAKAMQAGLTGASLPGLIEGDPKTLDALDQIAAAFYLIADAMLRARQPPSAG